jgi:hypothetical protein
MAVQQTDSKHAWLENLRPWHKWEVSDCLENVIELSQGQDVSPYFSTCGLYAVGSSLQRPDYNDIDLVLVGMDFRTVFLYDKVYLRDPQALVDSGLVVPASDPKALAKECGTVVLDGETYHRKQEANKPESLGPACDSCSYLSPIVDDLRRTLRIPEDKVRNPLQPYVFTGDERQLLCVRMPVHPQVEFIVLAEHLLVPFWKEWQKAQRLPFITLHEWPQAGETSIWQRPYITRFPPPAFIDANGRKPHDHALFNQEMYIPA